MSKSPKLPDEDLLKKKSNLTDELVKLQTDLNTAYNEKREAEIIIYSNKEGHAGVSVQDLEKANRDIKALRERIQEIQSELSKVKKEIADKKLAERHEKKKLNNIKQSKRESEASTSWWPAMQRSLASLAATPLDANLDTANLRGSLKGKHPKVNEVELSALPKRSESGGKLRKKKCTKKRCSKKRHSKKRHSKKRHSKKRHNKKKRTRRRR